LNPKVALFFLSFLPQFVDLHTEFIFISFAVLGIFFLITGSIWCLALVYGSAWLAGKVKHRDFAGVILKKITGTLFIGMAIRLGLAHAE